MKSVVQVRETLLHEAFARSGCYVNANVFDQKVAIAARRAVGHGEPMTLHRFISQHKGELCTDKMLEHRPNIHGALGFLLSFCGLSKEIIHDEA